jgi:6-phosphogluconolactonase
MAGLGPDVRVFRDPDALHRAAADLVVATAGKAVSERGQFLLCLSGGKTPEGLYAVLAQSPHREQIDWQHLVAYWGDERCVPAEDLNSNYGRARDLLLRHVPISPQNIHPVRTELDPDLAADDYARLLKRHAEAPLDWPRFDLVLLGLGEDGHTASLFPGIQPEPGRSTMASKAAASRPGPWRVSLTPAVFNSARTVVFLVQGGTKSKIVASVLHGGSQPEQLPAQQIHPQNGSLIWLLDAAAAGAG